MLKPHLGAKRVVPAVPPPQGRPPLPLLRSRPRGQDCGEGTEIIHGIFTEQLESQDIAFSLPTVIFHTFYQIKRESIF